MRRLLVFLCVIALAGCGGDDGGGGGGGGASGGGGGGGGGDRLTKAEFSAEGKRICEASAKRTQEVVQAELAKDVVRKLGQTEQQLAAMKAGKPVVMDTMDKLEALEAPKAVEPHVKTLTSGVREVMEIFDDPKSIGQDELERLRKLTDETRTAAQKAGLEACLPENTPS